MHQTDDIMLCYCQRFHFSDVINRSPCQKYLKVDKLHCVLCLQPSVEFFSTQIETMLHSRHSRFKRIKSYQPAPSHLNCHVHILQG